METIELNRAGAESGSKAASLGRLRRLQLPVPDGFVVPAAAFAGNGHELTEDVRSCVERELFRLGDPTVAVRSSASDEDGALVSAAGLYESIIGVSGVDDVCAAISQCRRSAGDPRVGDYRRRMDRRGDVGAEMSILVQVLVDAEISGVMFTPAESGGSTRIESSWGLGSSVVGGSLTPDAFEVVAGDVSTAVIGDKRTRVDMNHDGSGVRTSVVPSHMRCARTLDDAALGELAALGDLVAELLGAPQDIEWVIAAGAVHLVQSRPVTVALPGPTVPASYDAHAEAGALLGTPGSRGVVTAAARVVSGPAWFSEVNPGEVVVCSHTDPAWTPLFSSAAGIVTEVGGVLSHAAIVAREYGIPAVLGVDRATRLIADGDRLTIDGTSGTVTRR